MLKKILNREIWENTIKEVLFFTLAGMVIVNFVSSVVYLNAVFKIDSTDMLDISILTTVLLLIYSIIHLWPFPERK